MKIIKLSLWILLYFSLGHAWAEIVSLPTQIKLEVGSSQALSLRAEIKQHGALSKVVLSNAKALDVQQQADSLILFAQQPQALKLGLWFEDQHYQTIDILIYSQQRALLDGFLALYIESPLVKKTSPEKIWLSGTVPFLEGEQLKSLANSFSELDLSQLIIEAPLPKMLELEVQVVELKQSYLKRQGLGWDPAAQGPSMGLLSDWLGGRKFRLFKDVEGAWYPDAAALGEQAWRGTHGYLGWRGSLHSTLNLLEERGVAKILATPRIRLESGESAEFLAGGELPIPQLNKEGAMEVTFHPYGVRLNTTAFLEANGRIRTQVEAELSRVDYSVSVQGVPGLLTRRNKTVVVLPARETVVLSGLKSTEFQHAESGLPGYSKAQGIFKRFGSSQEESLQNTELMIFITPTIVADEEARQMAQAKTTAYYYYQLAQANCQNELIWITRG